MCNKGGKHLEQGVLKCQEMLQVNSTASVRPPFGAFNPNIYPFKKVAPSTTKIVKKWKEPLFISKTASKAPNGMSLIIKIWRSTHQQYPAILRTVLTNVSGFIPNGSPG